MRNNYIAALLGLSVLFVPSVQAKTSMETVLQEQEIEQCKLPLVTLAEELIGKKTHRLHIDQPKHHADKYPLTVVGVISYNDQDAQVQFNATPMDGGECEVSYEEAFSLPENCIEVREQVFKKWKYIGKLSENTFFLRHKKRLTKNAMLTSTQNGASCLVTRRNSGI